MPNTHSTQLVIIDDVPINIRILMEALRDGYKLLPFSSIMEAIAFFRGNGRADLILMDIDMPMLNGYEAFKMIKQIPSAVDTPVIFITARVDVESELTAFDLGIVDYIRKPIIPGIARKRVALQINAVQKERMILQEAKTVKKLSEVTIKTLVSLVDRYDAGSEYHISRIIEFVTVLSIALRDRGIYSDEIDDYFIESMRMASPFHDCGKIYISENILTKPDRLTEGEYNQIKKHTIFGSKILHKACEMMGEPSFYDMAEILTLYYHERWDGSGYPFGIKGYEIPLCARVMTLADVYDALVSKKPYRDALSHKQAIDVIMDGRETAFDPIICDVLYEIRHEITEKVYSAADV